MKNLKSNRKNAGVTGIAYKACVWILSIMLVVTGMSPSFAANDADVKEGRGKVQTDVSNAFSSFYKNTESLLKTFKKNFDKASLKNKATESIKNEARNAKTQKETKGKEDKDGKHNKIKNKRGQTFNLNSSDNVYAEFDGNENLTVSAKNPLGDMNIDKDMWWHVAESIGDKIGVNEWNKAGVKNIRFNTKGIYLPEDSSAFFNELKGEIEGCENLNTSKVKHMNRMFYEATSAKPDVSRWDVSNVTDMNRMFYRAMSANPDVLEWNVSNVTNMSWMFSGATSAKPDVSEWNVSNVTDMNRMFYVATSANPDVSKWNTSKVTDTSGMFARAISANPDVSEWNVSNVTNMSWMFFDATSANPDVSEWNVSNVINMSYMLFRATSANPDVSKWNTSKVIDMSTMFYKATSANPDVSKWNVSSVTNMKGMFSEATSANPDVSSWNVSSVTDMDWMFAGATSANPDVSSWNVSNVTDMSRMLNSTGVIKVDISRWVLNEKLLEQYDRVSNIFDGCSKLECLKTPVGLKTSISGANKGFKIVKLKKGDTAGVLLEYQNLYHKYTINNDGDKKAVYHIYAKDVYAGVIFDKNSGNTEGWVNHEIVKKNKSIRESGGRLPTEKPTLAGDEFLGWTTKKNVVSSIFNANTKVNTDTTVYALWKKNQKVSVRFEKNGGSGEMPAKQVEKDSNYRLPACSFTAPAGKEFDKWSVVVGTAAAVEKMPKDKITASDDVTVKAVWKEENLVPLPPGKVRLTLDGNGGVLTGGAAATIDVDEGSTVKEQLESAVANKIFTKDEYKLIGFSRSKFATAADYNLDNPIYSNITLYAVYEETAVFTNVTIKYQIFNMDDVVIENIAEGKPIGNKLDGHMKHRDGYRFLGFAKTDDSIKPDFFKKSIVTNGLVLYPVYKEIGNVDKAKVAFNLNDGTDANLKTQLVTRYESLGAKMPNDKYEREDYLFTGWAKSKAAKYPDFFRGTTVKGDITVYAVWKSLYDERLGQAVLKVSAKAKGYELTIEPPNANLHTGFEIFRSEERDFKPSKDNKIATVDRDALKYLDENADNGKAYYYAVRAIDADGSYNGTKVTYIGKLSDKVLAAPLPKDKGVTATVAGKGAVDLEFNKTMAAAGYKVTVTAPYDKKFKAIERFVKADKLVAAGAGKVKANLTGLPMGKFLAFKLEALEADNTKLVEYGNSFAFMMGAVDKLTAKVNKKSRVLNVKFKAMKGVNGYEAKIVIGGKVKTVKLKKGKKKLRGFIVGSIKLPKKKGNYTFTIRAFKKIGKLKYFGQTITKVVR